MSAVISYISNDEASVKKAFDQLMVARAGNKTQVLIDMKQNPIVIANADIWEGELSQTIEIAKPWIAGESLLLGWLRTHNGQTYLCVQSHTTQTGWEPPVVPALFILKPVPQPGQTYPDWVQPIGAQDAYALGDKVRHNNANWESQYAANVWEPGVFGWITI